MTLRYARRYSDGSFNVSAMEDDFDIARKRLSGSTDDDDTELVQVEIEIVRTFGQPKLELVPSQVCACCGHPWHTP
jgi:hypothetical protein